MRKTIIYLLLSFSLYQCAPKPEPNNADLIKLADSIRSSALAHQESFAMLKDICAIGPRLSGSSNSLKFINWISRRMREIGFDTVWLQPVTVPHWERGKTEIARVTSASNSHGKQLSVAALGGSVGTTGLNCGVIEVASFDELKLKAALVKNKIVFFNVRFDNTELSPFISYGKIASYRTTAAREAAKYGAMAVIVRSITSRRDNVPHVGSMSYFDTVMKIPAVSIGWLDGDYLHDLLIKDKNVKIYIKLSCKQLGTAPSFNVIGELRGSKYPEKIILTGAHSDCWDKGTGAHDDAAGCVQAIESVMLLKRLAIKPLHTLRTVLFINEENGAKGARAYADWSDSTRQNHLAAIESDEGGFTPKGFNISSDSTTELSFNNYVPVLRRCGIDFIQHGSTGVDIGHLNKCPLLFSYVPDGQRYFDVHHSANDVIEEVNPRELELGSAAISMLIYILDHR